jgi:hypothetical protein
MLSAIASLLAPRAAGALVAAAGAVLLVMA